MRFIFAAAAIAVTASAESIQFPLGEEAEVFASTYVWWGPTVELDTGVKLLAGGKVDYSVKGDSAD